MTSRNPLKNTGSVQSLCEYIWSLEEKYQLLDARIQNIKFWQAQRMVIYYQLAEKSGLFQKPHTTPVRADFVRHTLSIFRNCLFRNPFLAKQADYLVVPHARTQLLDGQHQDIHSFYLVEKLQSEGNSVTVLEPPFLGEHKSPLLSNKKHLDLVFAVAAIGSKLFPVHFTNDEKALLGRIEQTIADDLGIKINLRTIFRHAVRNFRIRHFFYRLLLKKIRPSSLFVVNAYAHPELVFAARQLSIPTHEIQHGTFSPYHLGYSFPGRTTALDYFPDYVHVWSDYWKWLMPMPIAQQHIIVSGFPYFERRKVVYGSIQRIPGRVIVLSQGVLGDLLAKAVLENMDFFAGKSLHYKLHPGEYDRWQDYPHLVKLAQHHDVAILTDCDLYYEFAMAEYAAGVFSTAIYEAVDFDCKPVLFDLPGIEYMTSFIRYHGLDKTGDIFFPPDAAINGKLRP